jgi:hypothetical protein
MMPTEKLLERLEGVRRSGDGWSAKCPAHEDRAPSLSIGEGDDGRVLVTCHAGCDTTKVLSELGLDASDLFVPNPHTGRGDVVEAVYQYRDERNTVLFEKVRYSPKRFTQRKPSANGYEYRLNGVRRVPYRLPEVLEGIGQGRWVVIVEGEKAADRLAGLGFVATCGSGGAGKWHLTEHEAFTDAKVAVLPDNDDVGRNHALDVARSLDGLAADVRLVELPEVPEKGDVYDWLRDHEAGELRDYITNAPTFEGGYVNEHGLIPQAPRSETSGPRLVVASSIRIDRPTWVYEGRIPAAGVTLLAGREGFGKTAFACYLAARVTRGQLAGDRRGVPGDVIYLGVEDARDCVLVPRLIAAGADLDRVHFLVMPSGAQFAVADDVANLGVLLAQLADPALVFVDPLDSHLGDKVDSHRKAEVQRAIGMLATLAQEHACAVVGVAHLNKGDAHDLLARVVGSVGFTTAVRSVIGIGEHPNDEHDRVAVLAKSNLTDRVTVPAVRFRVEGTEVAHPDGGDPIDTANVVILGEELGIDPHSIVGGLDAEARTERDEAADWLVTLLRDAEDRSMPYRTIERLARDEGISRATLHRARHRAGVVVNRDEKARGRPSTWTLSEAEGDDAFGSADSVSPLSPSRETKPNQGPTSPYADTDGVSSHAPGIETETEPDACSRCRATGVRLIAHYSGSGAYCPECCLAMYPEPEAAF